jgi:2-polyprenyl-6-hydroxyphenyl methylase/3-demethylubiquinone-9 3-methyltransferase
MEMLEHVPHPAATVAALARLVRPGGAVFVSTINRNLKSFLLAIVAAEYVLQADPARHPRIRAPDPPGGACALGARGGSACERDCGHRFQSACTQEVRLTRDPAVNYIAHFES